MTVQTPKRRTKNCPRFFAIDFFCGAGGTTRGIIDAGGYVIAGIDKDPSVERTYCENNSNESLDGAPPTFLARDVFAKTRAYTQGQQTQLTTELRALIRKYRKLAPGIPVLFAICAPCQPFTTLSKSPLTANRTNGRKKDRGLLREATKFVDLFRPNFVLSENVAGIREEKFGGVWQSFNKQLVDLGYVTGTKVVDAYRFGIPQYRKRSILLAVRGRLASRYTRENGSTLMVPEADPDSEIISVSDAIGHFPPISAGESHPEIPNHKSRGLSELNWQRLSSAKPGESNSYMANTTFGDLTLACHKRVVKKFSKPGFCDVYTRMRPDRPAPTITTRCYSVSNGRFGHFESKQVRGISPREAAALQSFRDDYIFYPTDQLEPVARMIGNAVPPKLAKFFANFLVNAVSK